MIRVERGWAGHFVCSERCLFRRNTLLKYRNRRVIVSTVGMMRDGHGNGSGYDTIGIGGRYYETMAFEAKYEAPYWDADVTKRLSFNSEWAICAESITKLPLDADNLANEMHDKVVDEIAGVLVTELPRKPRKGKPC